MVNMPEEKDIEFADAELTNLLASIPKVSAPNDFEFRVSARIASTRTAAKPRGLFGALRIAVPAAALLAVTATALMLNPYWSETATVSEPTEIAVAKKPVEAPAAVPGREIEMPPTTFASNGPSIQPERRMAADESLTSVSRGPSNDEAGTSFVESGTQGEKIYPRGINPNVDSRPVSPNETRTGISIRDILSQLGVSFSPTANGLRVDSVSANSIAARSGLITGDVIESLNGQRVSAETVLFGTFAAKRILVRRDGKAVDISLGR